LLTELKKEVLLQFEDENIKNFYEKYENLQVKFQDLQQEVKDLRIYNEQLQYEIQVLKNEIQVLQNEIQALQKKNEQLQYENEQLRYENKRLQLLVSKLSVEIATLKEKVKKSEEEVDELRKKQMVLKYRDWTQAFMRVLVSEFHEFGSYTDLKETIASEIYAKKFDHQLEKLKNLKSILNNYDLTPAELRTLIGLKHRGNVEFHINKNQTVQEAISELNVIEFPQNLEIYKLPLGKLLRALETMKGSNLVLNSVLPFQ
jgi:FtsZ-binding cell division protein ZapB